MDARRRLFLICAFFALTLASVHAVAPERMVLDSYADFAAGRCRSVTLSDEGVLKAAPKMEQVAEWPAVEPSPLLKTKKEVKPGDASAAETTDRTSPALGVAGIWSVLIEPGGSWLLGTSEEGKLIRQGDGGAGQPAVLEVAAQFAETHVYALARGSDGSIFVGTSPDGKIYRLPPGASPNTKPEEYFNPKEKYIWALAFDAQGRLYAATGTEGRIYRITGPNQGEVYYDSDETHIRCLRFAPDGALLAGSAKNGLVYRITALGEATAIAAANRQEVTALTFAPDGTLYAAATGPVKSVAEAKSRQAPAGPLAALKAMLTTAAGPDPTSGSATPGQATLGGDAGRSSSSASELYQIRAGVALKIWETSETIHCIEWDKALDAVVVGTGGQGQIYTVDERGHSSRLAESDSAHVMALAPLVGGQWAVAASKPGRTYRLGGERTTLGLYESDVLDAKLPARWGMVTAKPFFAEPAKGQNPNAVPGIILQTRTGNTPQPDKSWAPWLIVRDGKSRSPVARYAQVRLELPRGAALDRLEVVCLPVNLSPQVHRIEVLPAGVGYEPLVSPAPPLPPRSADQLVAGQEKAEAMAGDLRPPPRFQPTSATGLRTAAWKAADPNDDALEYSISYQQEGEAGWHLLAKELEQPVWSWDASGWPEGYYHLKVEASDALENTLADARTDSAVSKAFLVDNTPPQIRIVMDHNGLAIFEITDTASELVSVEVSCEGERGMRFRAVAPVDGILDSRSERFEVQRAAGARLFIRAEDRGGNVASAALGP